MSTEAKAVQGEVAKQNVKIIMKSGSGENKERRDKSQETARGVGHLHPWKQTGRGVLMLSRQQTFLCFSCVQIG